jgi:hypothetical protein
MASGPSSSNNVSSTQVFPVALSNSSSFAGIALCIVMLGTLNDERHDLIAIAPQRTNRMIRDSMPTSR